MLDKLIQKFPPDKLITAGCCSIAAGVCFGHFPVLMSGGAVLLALGGLLSGRFRQIFSDKQSWMFILLFMLPLVSGIYSENTSQWATETFRKLSFVLIAVGVAGYTQITWRQTQYIIIIFSSVMLVSTLLTLIDYARHFEKYTEGALHSEGIPIITGISHIYFSLLLVLAVLFSYMQFKNPRTSRSWKYIWLIAGLFFFMSLHIIASRTGWLALYGMVFVMLVREIVKRKKYILGVAMLAVLAFIPVIAYQVSPSFRNKVLNTQEDLSHYYNNQYLNYYSVSMRFEAWKVCWQIFTEHPLIGVGCADLPDQMHRVYDQKQINKEVRVDEAHNQFLEMMAGHGIPGFLVLTLSLVFIISGGRYKEAFPLGVFTIYFLGFLFESFLESHSGIASYTLFAMLACKWPTEPEV